MRVRWLTITILLAGCASLAKLPSSEPSVTGCQAFTRHPREVISVSGLTDHDELEPAWLKEELGPHTIDDWIRRYAAQSMASWEPDSARREVRMLLEREFLHDAWNQLVRLSAPGDRFFYYTTPDNYWSSLAGQDGIVVLRRCVVVAKSILVQS
jgi:hypothetical protein